MSDPGSVTARRFSFTTRASVDEATGEVVGLDDVDIRVRWLLDLVTAAGSELRARLWHAATFDVLAAGRDRQDRKLPVSGHVAAASGVGAGVSGRGVRTVAGEPGGDRAGAGEPANPGLP